MANQVSLKDFMVKIHDKLVDDIAESKCEPKMAYFIPRADGDPDELLWQLAKGLIKIKTEMSNGVTYSSDNIITIKGFNSNSNILLQSILSNEHFKQCKYYKLFLSCLSEIIKMK